MIRNKNYYNYIFILVLMHTWQIFARDILVEGKAAVFIPTNHLFRKIYHETGIYGGQVTAQLIKDLYAWASISGLTQKGRSCIGNNPTRVTLVPIDFGLKYLHNFNLVDVYLGLGANISYLQTKDHAPFVICKRSNWGGGVTAQSGCNIYLYKSLFLDLFVDYSYIKVRFSQNNKVQSHSAFASNVSIGAGLGYKF